MKLAESTTLLFLARRNDFMLYIFLCWNNIFAILSFETTISPERLKTHSEPMYILRKNFENGWIHHNDDPKFDWMSRSQLKDHKLDNFRIKFNN